MKSSPHAHLKYPFLLRFFHWSIALLMMGMVIMGFVMAEILTPPFKYTFYDWHKAIGLTVFVFVLLRIGVRLISDVPPLPETVACHERFLAKTVYLLLYVLMIAFPLSGYIMSAAGNHPIDWFGIHVPLLIKENKDLAKAAHTLHEVFGYALIGLIALHILGFFKHLLFDRENLLKRMW